MGTDETLLRAILSVLGRQALPPAEVIRIISPTSGGQKQIRAYNLCDGRTPQSDVSKKAQLDKGSLSRSISRWIEAGIVFRVGPEQYPMHIYRLRKDDVIKK